MTLTPVRFAALARSSPWRWRTLRFTAAWRVPDTLPRPSGVRAWVRRPKSLRVEEPNGRVLMEQRDDPLWRQVPRAEGPEFDTDGLVLRRPPGHLLLDYDDPMYENYHWVAMLDPVEFADGREPEFGEPAPDPVTVANLAEVSHHGRPAWQADVVPTERYDPRCSCCPLLFSKASEDIEAEAGGPVQRDREQGLRYADAHRVRLDVQTGVCVYTEELGGSRAGTGHDVRIEAVDEDMPDELFGFRTKTGRNRQ